MHNTVTNDVSTYLKYIKIQQIKIDTIWIQSKLLPSGYSIFNHASTNSVNQLCHSKWLCNNRIIQGEICYMIFWLRLALRKYDINAQNTPSNSTSTPEYHDDMPLLMEPKRVSSSKIKPNATI